MTPLRISATQLESWRLFRTADWMTEDRLLASLRDTFVPSREVLIGQAFGSIVATPDAYRQPGGYVCEGFSFDDATIQPFLDLVDRRGLFELKGTYPFGNVTLVAKADHIVGTHLSEFKTTGSTFDADKYAASVQWRVMALIFAPSLITYRVAILDDHENGVVEIKGVENLTLYPYADLRQDVGELVNDLTVYIRLRHLEPYFQPKPAPEVVGA